ncbi:DUF6046 domain-containing protein [Pseudarcicella hirudinis]|nr:DUF6046 domain-containing protein [Pseudarcicella hirudinis]
MRLPVGFAKPETPADIWWFPVEPLVTLAKQKFIVATPLANSKYYRGTVKELFSDGDYGITIEGSIIDISPANYGEKDERNINKLKDFLDYNRSLLIYCDLTTDFGISHIAIQQIPRLQMQGNRLDYIVQGLSDQIFELLN